MKKYDFLEIGFLVMLFFMVFLLVFVAYFIGYIDGQVEILLRVVDIIGQAEVQ